MDMEIIVGKRITLRPITEADTNMVLEWRNSDRTVRNFYYRNPVTPEDHKAWLNEKVGKGLVWQYIVRANETDIGCVYVQHIDEKNLSGESGLFFSEDAPSGEGYATEALILFSEEMCFKKLGLLYLNAKVQSKNEVSRHLHVSAGYREVKAVPGENCSDGETVTSIYFRKDVNSYSFSGRGFNPPGDMAIGKNDSKKTLVKAHTGKISISDEGLLGALVPGSKSITNRALLIAMLAKGESLLKGVLFSDDTEGFLSCMSELGVETFVDRNDCTVRVKGCGGDIPNKKANLNVGSAGTAARFLTAVLGLTDGGEYHMDSSDQMKKRPMKPLLDALTEMGCEVEYEEEEGFFPFVLKPHGFKKDEVTVDIDKSSQFLSALLIAAPLAGKEIKINVTGSHGLSYVEMTGKIMRAFGAGYNILPGHTGADKSSGCTVIDKFPKCTEAKDGSSLDERISNYDTEDNYRTYIVNIAEYKAADYDIEPDASAACYFAAMSPLIKTCIVLKGLHFDAMQGDVRFIELLEKLGLVECEDTRDGIKVSPAFGSFNATNHTIDNSETVNSTVWNSAAGVGSVDDNDKACSTKFEMKKGEIVVDMSGFSDQTITLAAIAPYIINKLKTITAPPAVTIPTESQFVKGIRITGISHIRNQECDRISAIVTELKRMGVDASEKGDDIVIGLPNVEPDVAPDNLPTTTIQSYNDHRMAMGFSLAGLYIPDIAIQNPMCCAKTFPDYFAYLDELMEIINA